MQNSFSETERSTLYRVIAARRDVRRFKAGAVLPSDVLDRILQAAHQAPSVGLPPVNPQWQQKACGAGVPPATAAAPPAASRKQAGGTPAQSAKTAGGTPAPQLEFTDPRATPFVEPKSRGYLPHLYKEAGSYFVTFRLWDAVVPKEERKACDAGEPKGCGAGVPPASSKKPAAGTAAPQKKHKTREEIAAEFEPPLRLGSCMLANPKVAEMVQNSVKHFHAQRYYLHAWCVMGNHLHVVYTATGEHTPKDIHHSWKSYTAHQANEILKRNGTFWESEGFDLHRIRGEQSRRSGSVPTQRRLALEQCWHTLGSQQVTNLWCKASRHAIRIRP